MEDVLRNLIQLWELTEETLEAVADKLEVVSYIFNNGAKATDAALHNLRESHNTSHKSWMNHLKQTLTVIMWNVQESPIRS